MDKWKTNELLLAAANFPRQPHDTNESYCQRVYDQSLEKAKTAAEFGTKIHEAIEKYPLSSGLEGGVEQWIQKFGEWYDSRVASVLVQEAILFDHDIGLAGRCDCIAQGKGEFDGQIILPDWKTQNVKTDPRTGKKKPSFYDSWPRQLSFYSVAYAKKSGIFPTIPTCISVVIDSNEPSEPYIKVWSREEIIEAYEDTLIAAYRWFKRKKYWPMPVPFKIGFNIDLPS